VTIADSILHHPLLATGAAAGQTVLSAQHDVQLERVTALGEIDGARVDVSNSVLFSPVRWTDDRSCFRFSRLARGQTLPRRHRCTTAHPIVVGAWWRDAGYFHLHPNTSDAILQGAEHGGEMGVWMARRTGLRERAARTRLAGLTPIGRETHLVRVLPRLPFPGDSRP
jgi:hypothetical protein